MFEEAARRLLRLFFGGGADISVANPLPVDASPSAVALTEILRANDDALQSIQSEHKFGRSLNYFFNARGRLTATGVQQRIDPDTVWTDAGLGVLAGHDITSIYTRRTFKYPHLMARFGKLPVPAAGKYFWVGFEAGSSQGTGTGALYTLNGANYKIIAGAAGSFAVPIVQALLPANYSTAIHIYEHKINKQSYEFFVDGVLKGIILFGLPVGIPLWENNPPYALTGVRATAAPEITAFMEVTDPTGVWVIDIKPYYFNDFVASDGDPCPPRQYALYNESTATKWNGQVIAAGSITSHPVPVWGYPIKTLYFQANGAGSLVIQIYAGGGWRTTKTVPIAANTLDIQVFDIETPIMRCVFTPSGFPTTVTAAEVFLS